MENDIIDTLEREGNFRVNVDGRPTLVLLSDIIGVDICPARNRDSFHWIGRVIQLFLKCTRWVYLSYICCTVTSEDKRTIWYPVLWLNIFFEFFMWVEYIALVQTQNKQNIREKEKILVVFPVRRCQMCCFIVACCVMKVMIEQKAQNIDLKFLILGFHHMLCAFVVLSRLGFEDGGVTGTVKKMFKIA